MSEEDPGWKPGVWIAGLLSLLLFPFGLLYVGRPWLVITYLGLVFAAVGAGYPLALSPFVHELLVFLVVLVAMAHAIWLARGASPIPVRPWFTKWYGIAASFLMLAFPIVLTRSFFFEPFHLPAKSMAPGLPQGTYVVVSKFGFGNYGTYGISLPYRPRTAAVQRGDVLVFRYPEDESMSFIKRVVAVGGDKLEYRSKRLYVNGRKLTDEPHQASDGYEYATEVADAGSHEIVMFQAAPSEDFSYDVPPGTYFMMGDNRDNSRDSRYWGTVPDELLIGRLVLAINSKKQDGSTLNLN